MKEEIENLLACQPIKINGNIYEYMICDIDEETGTYTYNVFKKKFFGLISIPVFSTESEDLSECVKECKKFLNEKLKNK